MPLFPESGADIHRQPTPLPRHQNAGFEITYLAAGEVTWQIVDGPTLHLTGGSLAIMQPEIWHQGVYEIIQPCRLLYLVVNPSAPGAARYTPFSPEELQGIRTALEQAGNVTLLADVRMEALFRLLLEQMRAQHAGDVYQVSWIRTLLVQALLITLQSLRQHAQGQESPAIRQARAIMQAQLDAALAMEDIARQVGLSPSHFYERFKREVGQTPADYLNRLRCAQARELLTTTNTPIIEIAFSLGYSSSQYFANTFRKYTGMTPTAYRNKSKG
jgi:AraC-like DNA-binding protein